MDKSNPVSLPSTVTPGAFHTKSEEVEKAVEVPFREAVG
jgi:hypothetical protein